LKTFIGKDIQKEGQMPSVLSEDAKKIFKVLNISLERTTMTTSKCFA
jgi:uncharacterized protein YlaN (UPF0358 family)